jgi:hypothetical protein
MEKKILYIAKYTHEIDTVGPVKKIGKTKNIIGRMKSLTLGIVNVVPVIAYIGDAPIIDNFERDLHKTLEDYNVIGEWYKDEDNFIIEFIHSQVKKLKKLGIILQSVPISGEINN